MTEQQPYEVVREYADFELRRYPDHVVAETRVTGSFEGAGNTSFRRLVGYIGGRNTQSRKVAMTAPVVQETEDESAGRFVVGFVMPAGFDLASAPDPTDPDVRMRAVPAQTAAALTFSGRWTRERYDEHARGLLTALDAAGLDVVGPARFARFDPPWTPWFLRRNEVVVPVASPAV
ncbi:heme-binding protein [Nocardioides sp. zg-1230]|uniref:SOUL family heme-binding protein n=1 Tax=Nocardioides sp. zg-1230 TaxID=2736601 RepID=UPI001555B877|nr:heme-binding protein [Nocardioides sp. zg-1230]NPC41579.1 heme-binding protein [Nocardioides sp. zg-1230]